MTKNTPTQNATNKRNLILIIIALTIGIFSLLFNIYTYSMLQISNNDATSWGLTMGLSQSRLKHCYDNDIKPCTDDNIHDWNVTHPDDAFGPY